jgi:hypothetical protein
MSLLVFSSTSRIAHGLIRNFYKSGNFEKIVCADLYPSYWGIWSYLKLRQSLEGIESKTQITDHHINEKTDLYHAIKNATHVVYITHDYYANTFSKLSLIS